MGQCRVRCCGEADRARPNVANLFLPDFAAMTAIAFALLVAGGSFGAGLLGALTGLGGGIVVVPMLTLLFHVDLRYAIGASLVSVIATATIEKPSIKLTPIQIDNSKTGYGLPKLRKHKTAKITDSTPLMNSITRMPADSGKVNAIATPAKPDINR